MKRKYLAVPAIALSLVTVGFVDSAEAARRAKTTVTLKVEGTDLSGTVSSPKPIKCASERVVYVIKQVGRRGGGNDELIAYDTASYENGAYRWSTGNTGMEGRFYAKVRRTPNCKKDTSRTKLAEATP